MSIKKVIKRLLILAVSIYVVVGLLLFIFQKNLVYFPDNQDFNSCQGFKDSEKININGTRAYYKRNSDKLVIFYHGNAGSACMRSYLKDEFEKAGFSYAFVEYAGYSGDERRASEEALMKNVEDVNEFVKSQKFSKVIVVGESLGTSLAVYHSTIAGVDKLLLISPFNSVADMAKANYGIYPISLMLTESYDSGRRIKNSRAERIEIIHGNQDEIVPIEQAEKLFSEIKTNDKRFVKINGAHHNDIYNFNETYKYIIEFLND